MKKFLTDFCQSMGLSSEESRVVAEISKGVVSIFDIANNIGLPVPLLEATMVSIFSKCSVSSIGPLFSQMLEFSNSRQQTCMGFHRRPTVMVIDDEYEICEIMKDDLEARGVRCFAYTDPLIALRDCQYLKLDAIVTDFSMPNLNGLGLMQEVRRLYRALPPVIVVSAECHSDKFYELYDVGAYAILHKPYCERTLFETLLASYYDPPPTHERFASSNDGLILQVPHVKNLELLQIGRGGIQLGANYLKECLDLEPPFLPVGAALELELAFPNSKPLFRSFAEVAWRSSRFGVGIKFTRTSEYDLNLLREYVSHHQVDSFIPQPRRELCA